jgi:hypothetical protein
VFNKIASLRGGESSTKSSFLNILVKKLCLAELVFDVGLRRPDLPLTAIGCGWLTFEVADEDDDGGENEGPLLKE